MEMVWKMTMMMESLARAHDIVSRGFLDTAEFRTREWLFESARCKIMNTSKFIVKRILLMMISK